MVSREAAASLLLRARQQVMLGELDLAADLLGEAAVALREASEPPLLAEASWLAGFISLLEGRRASFEELSRSAVEVLAGAGHHAAAAASDLLRAELLQRLDIEEQVDRLGDAAVLEFVRVHCSFLLDIAERGAASFPFPPWHMVHRDREQLVLLLALASQREAAPSPLAKLVREFALDGVEATLLLVLTGLALNEPLEVRARALDRSSRPGISARLLTTLASSDLETQHQALQRLAADRTLRRSRLIEERQGEPVAPGRERLGLDPDVAAFLHGVRRPVSDPAGVVELHPPGPSRPAAADAPVRGCLLRSPPAWLVVSGLAAQRRRRVEATTSALGRGLLVARMAEAPRPLVATRRWIMACARDARLHDAVLYLDYEETAPDDLAELVAVAGAEPCHFLCGVAGPYASQAAAAVGALPSRPILDFFR